MKQSLLLPHRYKTIGWCLLAVAVTAVVLNNVYTFDLEAKVFNLHRTDNYAWDIQAPVVNIHKPDNFGATGGTSPGIDHQNIYLSVVGILAIAGALLVGFARERQEDEFIAHLRLTSLQWALLTNQLLMLFCLVFLWGWDFFGVMVYNVVTTPIIFIIRFNYLLFRNAKRARHEK